MRCRNCGEEEFYEQDGLLWCANCNTQSQVVTVASEDFIDTKKSLAKEIRKKTKRVAKQKKERKGVLWSTSQAFNIILFKQMSNICEHFAHEFNTELATKLTKSLWFCYLKKSELAFHYKENYSADQSFPLHPNSRFRDIQILKYKVESLPAFKYPVSGQKKNTRLYKIGPDGLLRSIEDNKLFDEMEFFPDDDLIDAHLNDYFTDFYRDPRIFIKAKAKAKAEEKKTEEILLKSMEGIDLESPLEELIGQTSTSREELKKYNSDSDSASSVPFLDPNKSEVEDIFEIDDDDNDSREDNYDKELIRSAPAFTRRILRQRGVLKCKTSNIMLNDYFNELMTLPKTLAILNIVFRLMSVDIYLFDLIRWVNEAHIPFRYCFSVLPQDWLFIFNDFSTFANKYSPCAKNLSILSVQLAKYLELKHIPRPNLTKLMHRLARDLNLPKDIVCLIESEYNLLEHFSDELSPLWEAGDHCRPRAYMPLFERWALMAIVAVLKRLFESPDKMSDSTEDCECMSMRVNEEEMSLFIWNDWLKYTRLRLDLIHSYSPLTHNTNYEHIRDTKLLSKQLNDRTQTMTSFSDDKRHLSRKQEVMEKVQSVVHQYPLSVENSQTEDLPTLQPSLYPLTNLTNYALERIGSSETSEQMSIDFYETTRIAGWLCTHRKPFHCQYVGVGKEPKNWSNWSSSFKMLMYLSCIILQCKTKQLVPILTQMENRFFFKKRELNKKLSS